MTSTLPASASGTPSEARPSTLAEGDFKVADLSLAEFGRKEIQLAEHEMPGLMAIRREFAEAQPLAGARITGSLHMTIQTAVLIETLVALGAQVRWASCNIFSTQDHAAAAIVVGPNGTAEAPAGVPVYAWKGETLPEYWWCTEQVLAWPDGQGPNMILDDGGDATLLVHKGAEFEKAGAVPPVESADSEEYAVILERAAPLARRGRPALDPDRRRHQGRDRGDHHRRAPALRDAPGRHPALPGHQRQRLGDQEQVRQQVRLPALADRRHQPGHRRADRRQDGRRLGYGDVGKGCAESLRGQGARVVVTEVDPICALQAAMDGYQVATLDDVVEQADIFITATGCFDVITNEHMARMKHQAIVGNIGHFDNEIDMAGLAKRSDVERVNIKPQVDLWRFADGHAIIVLSEGRLLNLGNATGHPSFVMSNSFANQTIAQIELFTKTDEYPIGVYVLPKHLDEKVARLHLGALGAKLSS